MNYIKTYAFLLLGAFWCSPLVHAQTSSWVPCANENGTCSFQGTKQVRYGVSGSYAYKTATASIGCNNATFGDPKPGAGKSCDYSTSTQAPDLVVTSITTNPAQPVAGAPITYSAKITNIGSGATPAGVTLGLAFITDNGQPIWSSTYASSIAAGASITLTTNNGAAGLASITLASGSHTVWANVNDRIRFSESNLTNNKKSFVFNVAAAGATWVPCANENGSCAFQGTKQVRYGLTGYYSYKTATTSIGCDNATFGDPKPGAGKTCDYSSTTTLPTSSSGTFSLGMRPFSASSSWNTPVSSTATYTKLAWPDSTGYNYWVNWETYSPAVYIANSADPLVQVTIPYNWGWAAQTIGIRLPVGVTGAVGTDGEILMIDGNTVHNCWKFIRTSNTTGTCDAYGQADLVTGTGWGSKSPFLSAGIVAAGSSQFAGLIVQKETDAGEINHALQIVLDAPLNKPIEVGEAIYSDGRSSTGISQEGERLAIPRGTAMPSGLSPLGQKVFRAMQKYGVFNIDVARGVSTLRVQNNAYTQAIIDALRREASKLIPLLQRVN